MDRSKVRRAVCTVWRRLLEAALISSSGQSVYITCSRWRRFPAARARSLTRLAAFLRRQAPSSMVRAPTVTSKPPSNLMRMASSLSEVPFASPRILVFGRRTVTLAAPAKDNDNKDGNSAIPCWDDHALHLAWHRHGSASWDTLVEHPPALLQVLEVPGYRQQDVAGLFVGAPRRGVPGVAPRLDHRHRYPGLLEPVERELR